MNCLLNPVAATTYLEVASTFILLEFVMILGLFIIFEVNLLFIEIDPFLVPVEDALVFVVAS